MCYKLYHTKKKCFSHQLILFLCSYTNSYTAYSRGTKKHRGKQHEYTNFHHDILISCMATIQNVLNSFVVLRFMLHKVRYHIIAQKRYLPNKLLRLKNYIKILDLIFFVSNLSRHLSIKRLYFVKIGLSNKLSWGH